MNVVFDNIERFSGEKGMYRPFHNTDKNELTPSHLLLSHFSSPTFWGEVSPVCKKTGGCFFNIEESVGQNVLLPWRGREVGGGRGRFIFIGTSSK